MFRPLVIVALSLALSLVAPVSARQATPGPLPTIPAADECQVAPMTIDAVLAAWPAGTPVPPTDIASEDQLPQGTPADAPTSAAVTAFEREYLACYNTAQWLRIVALFTNNALSSFSGNFADEGELAAFLATAGTPVADAGSAVKIVLVVVRDVRVLPDGRVGAIVEWGRSTDPATVNEVNFHIYVQTDDGWRLDDEISGFEPSTQSASPTT